MTTHQQNEPQAAGAETSDQAAPEATPPTTPVALKLVVFTCGAIIMALEITGSRLLAPHFGNSIYVWSSLIGLFMAALATGYWAGGSVADRWPSFPLLATIVVIAGVFILLLPLLASPICRALAKGGADERSGPLLASLLLFFVPSALLGTVSPFSVRLATRDLAGVGRVAGRLYALSTMGSILGTLFTAFVLIPELGVSTILKILGLTLLITPLLALLLVGMAKRSNQAHASTMTALIMALLAGLTLAPLPPSPVHVLGANQELLVEQDSAYHHILVLREPGAPVGTGNAPGRTFLHFDKYRESGIHLEPPYESACEYTELFDLAWLFSNRIDSALFIGGGAGLGPRTFSRRYPSVSQLDLVEIDPDVLDIAKRYFHFEERGPIRAFVADGRMFVRRSETIYDLVVLDAFTIGGRIPPHLVTKEFFEEVAAHLEPDRGMILCNLNAAIEGKRSRLYRAVVKTLEEVFDRVHIFPKPDWWREPEDTRNIIVIGTQRDQYAGQDPVIVRESLLEKARQLTLQWEVDEQRRFEADGQEPTDWATWCGHNRRDRFVEFTEAYHVDLVPLEDVPLLTDDFAPIERMAF